MATVANASSDDEKTIFIYNVGKQKYITRGGNWGVEAVLGDVGMPFTVTKSGTGYKFVSNMQGANNVKTPGISFYYRKEAGDVLTNYLDQEATVFTATSVISNGITSYRLSAKPNYTDITTTYYIRGGQKASGSGTLEANASIAINGFQSMASDGSDQWIFVTLAERKKHIKYLSNTDVESVSSSFLISDNDFARNDKAISNWKYGDNATALSNAKEITDGSTTYYVGVNDYDTSVSGGLCTANIKGTSGKIYQTVTPLRAGWYEVRCNALTTTANSAKLYACEGSATKAETTKTEYAEANVLATTTKPGTYSDAEAIVNDGSHQISVRVYVDEADGNIEKLTFGVKVENGTESSWACIDNFELYYLGEAANAVVLDETKTSIDYMNTQNDKGEHSSTVYLHRSLTANVWNSLVLPFSMASNDVLNTFGSGTELCEFAGAKDEDNPNTIYFDKVNTIEVGKLYIIKPTTAEPTVGIKAESSKDNSISVTDKYYTIQNVRFGQEADFAADVKGDTKNESYNGDSKIQFVGTYVKKSKAIPANSYLLQAGTTDVEGSTGKWVYTTKPASSRGFRGWLQPTSGEAKGFTFNINGIEDTTTAIDGVAADTVKAQDSRIFNLAGQQVSGKLAKGLYIQNGKKFIVK